MALTHAVDKHIAQLEPGRGLFLGGTWREATTTFDVHDPGTGQVVAAISDATTSEATQAVEAAYAAGPAWRRTPPRERSETLRRTFELMTEDADRLTELIMLENGKPEADARAEVAYAAEFFRWFAEEAVRTSGGYGDSPAGGTRTVVTHRPVGVAALITPWTFPAAMATRKIAPPSRLAAPSWSSRPPRLR
jgi:succinate-semialdehyde dehydrogenase / glutarate-semialdehyde dehydrogenase